MKEVNLIIDGKGELSFISEPYVRINVLTKETYEKLADIIDKDTPAEVELIKLIDFDRGNYAVNCPNCEQTIALGYTKEETLSQIDRCCTHCGQALFGVEKEV